MEDRTILRHFVLTFFVAFAAIFVLLECEVLSYVAYSVEKGRLRALQETLPSAEELAEASLPARQVARLVSRSVVFIRTEGPPLTSIHGMPLEDLLKELEEEGVDEKELEEHRGRLEDYLRRMGRRSNVGSGFITNAEHGLILTNYHVVEGADLIEVQLADGRPPLRAEVIGADPPTDLAVIRIDADRLHQVQFGDSEAAEVGDAAFAMGNPFRLAGTVSRGIISGKGRHSVDIGGVIYQGFLQTDAVINPGNSGGPLVNLRGEVIGVNTAIATLTGHYEGVGFAIPAKRVLEVLPKLVSGEKIERGYLGIGLSSVTDDPDRAARLGWTERYGIIVSRVQPDTGAAAAGLQRDDILLRIDGTRVDADYQLIEAVGQMHPGRGVTLDIWRDGRRETVEATLGSRPD